MDALRTAKIPVWASCSTSPIRRRSIGTLTTTITRMVRGAALLGREDGSTDSVVFALRGRFEAYASIRRVPICEGNAIGQAMGVTFK